MLLLISPNTSPACYSAFHVFQYLTLRAHSGRDDGARDGTVHRSRHDRAAQPLPDRAAGAQRRAADPPAEGRHADHGRRPDPGRDRARHAALGGLSSRFIWILLLTTLAFGADRLLRRLPQTGGGRLQGPGGALEVLSQSVGGSRRGHRPAPPARSPAETSLYVPFFKTVAVPMSHLRVRRVRLPRDRRHQQRGESHRRPRRPRHHAGGDGGRGARRVRLRDRKHKIRRTTCRFPTYRASGRCSSSAPRSVGRRLGFLWFNAYPAQVFMGDVGALAIGARSAPSRS